MRDINDLYERCLAIVKECCGEDVVDGHIYTPISVSTRYVRKWGSCNSSADHKRHRITVKATILSETVPEYAAMSVVIHEILHACKGTYGHDRTWKEYGQKVMRRYPEIRISVCLPPDFFDKEVGFNRQYEIQCEGCGMIHRSSRLSKSITHPEHYRCGKCGGRLRRIK